MNHTATAADKPNSSGSTVLIIFSSLFAAERGRAGRGRGRGGRGRGREFDRHSATGRTDSGKAIAQGWGGDDPKREQDAEEGAVLDAVAEESSVATPANGETKADGAEAAAADAGAPAAVEEVDNTKTLDEYLAEQATKKAAINGTKAPTPRQADEWKEFGTKVQKASEDSESYFAATASSKESARAQKARKEKQAVEIDTYFEAPASGERGVRGGRGGSRGGAGRGRGSDRGSGRGGATRGSRGGPGGASGRSARGQANFSLDDSRAFPSLSA
ncbi:hypothetical protein K437DRAFT_258372 [Tilletiaria anomala UBC 951]|uniref:Hyaluronan/mRNA-binding protein domain-containing protein n=1 Tax=Tilletiaria anomala (strain ATCC 24038 / CBS 436.72 / UBC 951) TaxID=1037660 RepID=A0A066VQQ6_TILAU|nr:uncharacterized protein K437DRAFT_258372 [Tilletiaria anomala UBC 951]KDN41134.1 hypothetical protein K437DRAFT_258372 [Tilletiaria anomala UBC 951]